MAWRVGERVGERVSGVGRRVGRRVGATVGVSELYCVRFVGENVGEPDPVHAPPFSSDVRVKL